MNYRINFQFIAFAFLFCSAITIHATQIYVPSGFPTIQEGIDASVNGDTVIVAPGEYFENINMHGKNILLTSNYFVSNDFEDIANTIINGSIPAHPDTASVILIISGENSSCIIQGFTIKGGAGTKWLDEHSPGTYREGGGLLIQYSSPTIRYNYITGNVVNDFTGVSSTGGGAIRCGDSDPVIMNNIISNNEGTGYGGALVFNYCDHPVVKNNLISNNIGGEDYGGGAIWATGSSPAQVVEITNNTIVKNTAIGSGGYGGKGGGVFVFVVTIDIKNSIFRGNVQTIAGPLYSSGGIITTAYSDVEGGAIGEGNIDADPNFADTISCYLLNAGSPCVDAGDTSVLYNDIEDELTEGQALYPSFGTIANDMGMYGGPEAKLISACEIIIPGSVDEGYLQPMLIYPNPADETIVLLTEVNTQIQFINSSGNQMLKCNGKSTIDISTWPAGIYFYQVSKNEIMTASGSLIVK